VYLKRKLIAQFYFLIAVAGSLNSNELSHNHFLLNKNFRLNLSRLRFRAAFLGLAIRAFCAIRLLENTASRSGFRVQGMIKKNKKVSLAKKPFLVLSRRAIAGWLVVFFFVCAWMFAIGVLVGRGTAPIKFDITELQRKLEIAKEDSKQKEQGRPLEEPESIRDKTKLDFYEALKDDRDDAKISDMAPAPIINKKEESPPENEPPKLKKESLKRKTISQNKGNVKIESSDSGPPKPAEPSMNDSKGDRQPADKPYAIQVASFKAAEDADKKVAELKKKGFSAYRAIGKVPGQGIWYRVRLGDYSSKAAADDTMSKLRKAGMKPILVEK
jgi:cell division protein FtsN